MKKIVSIIHCQLSIISVLLMAGCSSEEDLSDGTLSGNGKTPLMIEVSLGTGSTVTRAAGQDFASGDTLWTYLRHTTGPRATEDPKEYPVTDADQAPRLVSFFKGSAAMDDDDANDGIKETSDLTVSYKAKNGSTVTALYWDDFSNSASAGTDLRTSGHGLQSYYGYCYNGGGGSNISTPLVQTTGALGWTVPTNQSTAATVVRHADLLWSAEQDPVPYGHAATQTPVSGHGTLTIPYTHAMSEVTVTVITDATFTSDAPLSGTVLTLNDMNTVTQLTAPSGAFTSTTPLDIVMCGDTYASGNSRSYTAIVAPGTMLKVGNELLSIVNVDDNNYTLEITAAMLAGDKWATNHTVVTNDGTYILTKPGVNYHLNVNVSKTAVSVIATLQDWTTVNATGTGVIQYPNDVVNINVTGEDFEEDSEFSLFWLQSTQSNTSAANRTNTDYEFVTVPKLISGVWTNTTPIYWPNQTNQYYFRALAKFKGTDNNNVHSIEKVGALDPLDKGTVVSQGLVADGYDILWGTTPEHTGTPNSNSFTDGQAIPPRTGDVPIAFKHAMSKVSFALETTNDAEVTVNNAKVNLTGATISISNLSTSGEIAIESGTVTPAATTTEAITSMAAPISNYIVIPQTIGDNAKLTITLTDGTTYSLQLNQCEDSSDNAIGSWERGKYYSYTIHLEKERITFRALIKDWDEKTGSGNANLEWD